MFKFIKNTIKNIHSFDDLKSTLLFYKYNPHGIPGVKEFLCKMGRHDFSVIEVDKMHNEVELQCFCCKHLKREFLDRSIFKN